jgi:alkylation response protein AidB-like acyl-CoA dehydrogenase
MDFAFTADQEQLRDAVRRLAAGGGDADTIWAAATAQLGLGGIGISEHRGGAGGDFVDAAVVIEEAGRALLPVPLTTSLVAGSVLDRAGDAASSYAESVATGERVAVVAIDLDHVLDGDRADLLLVTRADGVYAVDADAPGVGVTPVTTLDSSRGQAQVRLSADAPLTRIGDADAARVAVDLLRVALAVEAVGAARRCLEMTVGHLKTREQFGRPIGSFQALQHRAADLVVALESAASTAYYAAWAAAASPQELPVVAPMAKAVCAEAAWKVAAETIQMHGGIGFTWEHDAHRYFKRLTTTRLVLGAAHEQRRLVAERAGLLVSATAPSAR